MMSDERTNRTGSTGIGTPLGGLSVDYIDNVLSISLAGEKIWSSDGKCIHGKYRCMKCHILPDVIPANSSSFDKESQNTGKGLYRYVTTKQLFGDEEKGIPPIILVSPKKWWEMVEDGEAPQPIDDDSVTKSLWRVSDILDFLDNYEQK